MSNSEQSDEELMTAYMLGEYSAFETLYDRHKGQVHGYLLSKVRERSLAEDITQDTFLRLHRYRSRYNRSLPFLPWLFTIARSALLDRIRKEQHQRKVADEISPILASHITPELDLSALSTREHQALALRFGEDLDFNEIASRFSTSSSNVRQIISRAVRKLRHLVRGNDE